MAIKTLLQDRRDRLAETVRRKTRNKLKRKKKTK